MARFRILAIAVLAVVAVVAGIVAIAFGSGDDSPAPAVAASPTALPTPTDVTAGVDAGAAVAVWVGRLSQDGVARSYLVLAPTTVSPATPLVVGLHGRGTTPGAEATREGLVQYVARGEAVLVYPVGYEQAWNSDDDCCGGAATRGLDDVAFVGMVVDAVRERYRLTGPNELVGFDNGGRLAFAAVCRDVSRYAAIAVVGAGPAAGNCPQAEQPVPLFAGVSLDDPLLPTPADPQAASAVLTGLESGWTARNGCLGTPTVSAGGAATVRTWTACEANAVVETVAWRAVGHVWPTRDEVGSPDAGDLVWSFLSGVRQRTALAAG